MTILSIYRSHRMSGHNPVVSLRIAVAHYLRSRKCQKQTKPLRLSR